MTNEQYRLLTPIRRDFEQVSIIVDFQTIKVHNVVLPYSTAMLGAVVQFFVAKSTMFVVVQHS